MKGSRSTDKQLRKFSQVSYKYPQIITLILQNQYPPISKIDYQNVQKFYMKAMLKIYQTQQRKFPDPYKILNSIKEKEKKILEIQRALISCRQTIRVLQNKKIQKTEFLINQTLSQSQPINSQKNINTDLQNQYMKLKIKFLPIIQSYLTNSQSQILITSQNEHVIQVILQSINKIIKNFKRQIQTSQQKMIEKQRKNNQNIEQKYKRQIKQQAELIKKLSKKLNEITTDYNRNSQELKKIEKQNNQLHIQISQKHQSIVQKTNYADQLKQKFKNQLKKVQQMEKILQELRKKLTNQEDFLKDNQFNNTILNKRIKQLETNNQKVQKQSAYFRKKFEQKMLQRNLTKVMSSQNLTSLKLIEHEQKTPNVPTLQNKITELQKQLSLKGQKLQKQSQNLKQTRQLSQNIIKQWKKRLQKLIQDQEHELNMRDSLIAALQRQISQYREQLQILSKVNKQNTIIIKQYEQKLQIERTKNK